MSGLALKVYLTMTCLNSTVTFVWDEAADRVGPHDDLYLEWRLKAKMLREGGRDVQDR